MAPPAKLCALVRAGEPAAARVRLAARARGGRPDATRLYLLRPDRYVALVDPTGSPDALEPVPRGPLDNFAPVAACVLRPLAYPKTIAC